nr:hypothetical protein [Mycoplasmopsis bovis]
MLNSHSYIKHLCLDEKIDYSKLAHNELQLSLYGMVNTATKIVTDKKFTELWNNIIIKYANKISTPKSDDNFKSVVKSSKSSCNWWINSGIKRFRIK